jgi:uncharacterized membrane protein YgcG
MYMIFECAVCSVLIFLVAALLFAAGAVFIIIQEGAQAVVDATHRTLEGGSQRLPRRLAVLARGAGSWAHANALISFRSMNSTS